MGVQNKVLTDFAVGRTGRQDWAVNDILAPRVPVTRRGYEYADFSSGVHRLEEDTAGENSPANRVTTEETRATGTIEQHKLSEFLTSREVKDYGDEGTLDKHRRAKIAKLDEALKLRRMIRLQTLMEATASISNTAASAAFGAASDDPLGDIRTLITAVHNQGGTDPNTLVFPRSVWIDWIGTTEVQGAVNGFAIPSPELMANYFGGEGIEQILILSHSKDTSVKGQAESRSDIWASDKMWAMWLPGAAARSELTEFDPSPFKTFVDESNMERIDNITMEDPDGEKIIEFMDYDLKLTDSSSIHMLTGA